jgi:hypothetical protein
MYGYTIQTHSEDDEYITWKSYSFNGKLYLNPEKLLEDVKDVFNNVGNSRHAYSCFNIPTIEKINALTPNDNVLVLLENGKIHLSIVCHSVVS